MAFGINRQLLPCLAASALCLVLSACERNDMHNQPRHEPLEATTFFGDGMSSRPIVPGTIARGQLVSAEMRFAGPQPAGRPVAEGFPFEITRSDLLRGKQRFDIYCAVCHGAAGDGDGMIVRRGFTKPPSLHEQRLKDAPVGHFYNVITNGWGAMYSYNDRVFPEDRWRIAAYIRVLQLSQENAVASAQGAKPAAAGGGGEAGTSVPQPPQPAQPEQPPRENSEQPQSETPAAPAAPQPGAQQ